MSMMTQAHAALQQLAQLYPSMPMQHLQQALENAGMDLQMAAVALLDVTPPSQPAANTPVSTPPASRKATTQKRSPHSIKHTWGQLEQSQTAPMQYMASGHQQQVPGTESFPDLAPAGPANEQLGLIKRTTTSGLPAAGPTTGGHGPTAAANASRWSRGSRTPEPKVAPVQAATLARRSASATSFADMARLQQQAHTQQQRQQQHKVQEHEGTRRAKYNASSQSAAGDTADRGPTTGGNHQQSRGAASQDQAAAQLAAQQSWADPGLVLAVLHAVGFSVAEAHAALEDMATNHMHSRTCATIPAAAVTQQAAEVPHTSLSALATPAKEAPWPSNGQHAQGDIYYKHRREAIRLSHAWHKAVGRCGPLSYVPMLASSSHVMIMHATVYMMV